MSQQLQLLILLFLTTLPSRGIGSEEEGHHNTEEVTDFSKLEFDTHQLKGSRWSIERKLSKKNIVVYNAVEIVDITKVDVDTMSIRIEIFLQQRWEADEITLPPNLFKETDDKNVFVQAQAGILHTLWSPDSFIPTARQSGVAQLTTKQSVVNIFQNKTIIFKARLFAVLGCMFDFRWYPLDKQTCPMKLESYSQTVDIVHYLWEDMQPAVFTSGVKLLQYDITLPMPRHNGSSNRWGRGERYPYVQIDFIFERKLGHHMIQVIIPTTLVVILSWFSFWLGLDAVPGRVALLITCMLTLVTMHSSTKTAVPPVNYIKMTDIWMVGCMAFVFLALCEFVIVKYLEWRKKQELKEAEEDKLMWKIASQDKGFSNDPYMNRGGIPYQRPAWKVRNGVMPFLEPYAATNKRPSWIIIDRISRAFFPLSFGIFNAVFWPSLLVGAANQA